MPNFWTTSSHAGKTDSVGPWIGLFQVRHQIKEPGGGWGWVSGEPFSYSNWAPGKPNNLEEIEDYGQYLIVQGSNDQATWIDLPNDSLGLPRFSGQVSGLHGCECTGVDELLLVVDRAEVANG